MSWRGKKWSYEKWIDHKIDRKLTKDSNDVFPSESVDKLREKKINDKNVHENVSFAIFVNILLLFEQL